MVLLFFFKKKIDKKKFFTILKIIKYCKKSNKTFINLDNYKKQAFSIKGNNRILTFRKNKKTIGVQDVTKREFFTLIILVL